VHRVNSRIVGDPQVIQMGTQRISNGKAAFRQHRPARTRAFLGADPHSLAANFLFAGRSPGNLPRAYVIVIDHPVDCRPMFKDVEPLRSTENAELGARS
jgi:hypothetical protein